MLRQKMGLDWMEALDGRSSQMKMKNGASGRPKEEKFQWRARGRRRR
jgi:hypothetical protein